MATQAIWQNANDVVNVDPVVLAGGSQDTSTGVVTIDPALTGGAAWIDASGVLNVNVSTYSEKPVAPVTTTYSTPALKRVINLLLSFAVACGLALGPKLVLRYLAFRVVLSLSSVKKALRYLALRVTPSNSPAKTALRSLVFAVAVSYSSVRTFFRSLVLSVSVSYVRGTMFKALAFAFSVATTTTVAKTILLRRALPVTLLHSPAKKALRFLAFAATVSYSPAKMFFRSLSLSVSVSYVQGKMLKALTFAFSVATSRATVKRVSRYLTLPVTLSRATVKTTRRFISFSAISPALSPVKIVQLSARMQVRASVAFSGFRSIARTIVDRLKDVAMILSGARGRVSSRYRLFVSNILGEQVQELKGVVGPGSSGTVTVTMDNYRDAAWGIQLSTFATDAFDPVSDYLTPVMEVRNKDRWEQFSLGLYRFDRPADELYPRFGIWQLRGYSPELLLLGDQADPSYVLKAGTPILATVRGILQNQFGIPGSMIDLPLVDKQLPTDQAFGTQSGSGSLLWLRIINAILNAGGWYALFSDAYGRYTTRPVDPVSDRTPDVYYGPQHGVSVRTGLGGGGTAGVAGSYDDSAFANIVVVRVQDANQEPPLWARVENHDANSPASIEALGRRVLKTVELQTATDQQVVTDRANRELAERSGLWRKFSILTMPDPRRGPKEIYGLELPRENGEDISGVYRVSDWSLPLTEKAGSMKHNVKIWKRLEGM